MIPYLYKYKIKTLKHADRIFQYTLKTGLIFIGQGITYFPKISQRDLPNKRGVLRTISFDVELH